MQPIVQTNHYERTSADAARQSRLVMSPRFLDVAEDSTTAADSLKLMPCKTRGVPSCVSTGSSPDFVRGGSCLHATFKPTEALLSRDRKAPLMAPKLRSDKIGGGVPHSSH